jgi:alpha-1,3-glucosyltransferase
MILSPTFWKRIILLWIASSIVKVLLQPSYHSTDFFVHLHWKALTRQIPQPANWYFDDEFVATRHTLDYPPLFVWWEAFWAHLLPPQRLIPSVVGRLLIPADGTLKPLDQDWTNFCLQPFPSNDNPSEISDDLTFPPILHDKALLQEYPACKSYQRTTVLLSDIILWCGAGILSAVAVQPQHFWSVFLSIVGHPALLWLDHIHFQYNGALLGVWMLSLSCLVSGRRQSSSSLTYDIYHLTAAVLFALLLTLKHLYLPLSLWYLVYLFRVYCYKPNTRTTLSSLWVSVHWKRFTMMGLVTLSTLTLPFVPILWPEDALYSRKDRLLRIFERLFPFGRGLVHVYWAGNIWAFYTAANKALRFVTGLSLPTVTPDVAASTLLLAVSPGAVFGAWQAARQVNTACTNSSSLRKESPDNNTSQDATFWDSLTFTTFASFATAYHGHEKAILTSLVPLTVGFCTGNPHLVWRTQALSLLSLLPLLYPATETLFKLVSMVAFLSATYSTWIGKSEMPYPVLENRVTIATAVTVVVTIVILEGFPLAWWGRYPFTPLAVTSLVSATGLSLLGWGQVGYQLIQDCS